MFASFGLAAQPRAGYSPQVLRHGIRRHRREQLQRPLVVVHREVRHHRIAVVVVVENIERPGILTPLQQLHTPGIGRVELRGVNRILDHPLAAKIIAEVHGAELRVDHLLQIGVLSGEAFAQQPLAPVRISLRREELQHRLAVRQRRVRADAVHQLGPRLGDPPHRQQRVDTPAVVTHQVAFQRLGTPPREALVEGVASLRRGGGCEGDRIDVELLLLDDPAHQAGNLLQLAAVVAQRIHHAGIAHKETDVVAVADRNVLVNHTDAVARQRVDKGEHRRDEVSQRIRGRQPVGAVVHGLHLPRERDEYLLRGLVRRYLLRVVVSDCAAALD